MTEYEIAALAISQAQVTAQYVIGIGQISLIGYGLYRMGVASKQRDKQLDGISQALERQGQALERVGRGIEELLKRSA